MVGKEAGNVAKVRKIEAIHSAPPRLKRVAAYARVSMETERLKHSLSAQISYYSDLIQKHPGWVYAGVFADYGVTGTKTDRPEFQRMLAECEAGSIDIILTKSVSRLGRNTVDQLNTIRHLKELGIEVQFEKEHINTLSGDGELLLTLLAAFAQEESRSISENSKWGIRKGYEKGKTRGCKIYGYRTVGGQLAIKENEAEVVRRIFQMFLQGDSCYIIAQKLNKEGVKAYGGKDFHGAVIGWMIRQEKYAGCSLGQKYYVQDHITHKEVKNGGQLPQYFIEDAHPAIISMETFQAAQEEFARRYGVEIVNGIAERASYLKRGGPECRPSPLHRKAYWSEEQRKRQSEFFSKRENVENIYAFSRFIRCEGCGNKLVGQKRTFCDGSSEVHWVCGDHNRIAPGAPRPIVLRDSALKVQIAGAMHMDAFDEEKMHAQLSEISVSVDRITLCFRDGHTREFTYVQPKQKKRRRPNGNG